MREIKFRAIDRHSGKWVHGLPASDTETVDYSEIPSLFVGATENEDCYLSEIIPGTLCQYTGLKDKNGKEIFEGDIIRTHFSFSHEVTQEPFIIQWNKDKAMFEGVKQNPEQDEYLRSFSFFPEQRFIYEVIGNIHENPELLEV